MKSIFALLLTLIALNTFGQPVSISQLPVYIGDPSGGWVPVVINNTTRKVDAKYLHYLGFDSCIVTYGSAKDTLRFFNRNSNYTFTLLYNKTITPAQIQSDWAQSNNALLDYIKNKPSLGTAAALNVPTSGNAASNQVVLGNDTRLSGGGGGGGFAIIDTPYNNPYYKSLSLLNFNNKTIKVRNGGTIRITMGGDSHVELQRIYDHGMKYAVGSKIGLRGVGYLSPVFNVVGAYNMTASPFDGHGFIDTNTIYALNGKGMWGGAGTSAITYSIQTGASSPYGDQTFTQIKVFYYRQSGGGSFTLTDPNGTPHVKSTAGAAGLDSLIISGITVNGTQSFSYNVTTPSTAGVLLLSFELSTPGAAGALIDRVGHSGWKASDYTHLDSIMWVTQLTELNPDVFIWNLGTNDCFAQRDTILFYNQMDSLITRTRAAQPYVDITLMGQLQPSVNNRGAISYQAYNRALKRLAKARGCTFFDNSLLLGDFATNIRNGDINVPTDSIHESQDAGTKICEALVHQIPSLDFMPGLPVYNYPLQINAAYSPSAANAIIYTNNTAVITALGTNRLLMGTSGSAGSFTIRDTLNQVAAGANAVYNVTPSGSSFTINNTAGNKHTILAFENSTTIDNSAVGQFITANPILSGHPSTTYIGTQAGRNGITLNHTPSGNHYIDISNEDGLGYDFNLLFTNNAQNPAYATVPIYWDFERKYTGLKGNYFGTSDGLQFAVNSQIVLAAQFDNTQFTNSSEETMNWMFRSTKASANSPTFNMGIWGWDGHVSISPGDSLHKAALLYVGGANLAAGNISTPTMMFQPMTNTQRDAISSPGEGLVIYSMTDHAAEFWNGTAWKTVTTN